jgi:hypothetical protein
MKIKILFVLLFFNTSLALADPTLVQVCGVEGSGVGSNAQTIQLCKAAYDSGNSWVINDNNSRVRASVAVVCAYSCLSGGLGGSCTSGGGSPCSQAVDNGTKSYQYNNLSQDSYTMAQNNGSNALSMNSTSSSVGVVQPQSQGQSGMPSSCQAALATGSVQDRTACAVATDPTLPPFVQDPQFQADFQKATGFPLQQALNENNDSLMQTYIPAGLEHAMNNVASTTSASDFLSGGAKLVSGVLSNLSSAEERSYLLSHILPQKLAGLIPGVDYDRNAKRPHTGTTALAQVRTQDPSPLGISTVADRRPAESGGENPLTGENGDLFLRVSSRYRISLLQGRVNHLNWATRMNQMMSEP